MNPKELERKEFADFGATLNEVDEPTDVKDNEVTRCLNWKVHEDGKSRIKRLGCSKLDAFYDFGGKIVRGLFDFWDDYGNAREVVVVEDEVWISGFEAFPGGPGWTKLYTSGTSLAGPVKIVAFNRERPIVVGLDANLMIEPTQAVTLGIVAPTTTATFGPSGSGGALTGDFKYVFTFYRSGNFPCESNPSPETATVTLSAEKAELIGIPVSTDPKVDMKRIYRTTEGGALLYWVADIPNAQTTYTDNITALGDEVSYDRFPPPLAKFVEIFDEKAWFIPVAFPNQLHFTNTGTAEEMASANIIQVKGKDSDHLVAIKAFGDSLYVYKGKSWFRLDKVGDSEYELTEMREKSGLDAACSLAVIGPILFWKSKFGIEMYNAQTLFRPLLSRYLSKTLGSINLASIGKAFGEMNEAEDEYWLAVPTGAETEPDTVIVFNYLNGTITVYKFPDAITAMHNFRDGSSNPIFLTGTDGGDVLIQGSGYTDYGTLIESSWRTRVWRGATGTRALWNLLQRVYIEYAIPAGRSIKFSVYANKDEDPIGSIELDGSTPQIEGAIEQITKRVDLGVRAAYFGFGFENNQDANGECRVSGFDAYFKRRFWKRDVYGAGVGAGEA